MKRYTHAFFKSQKPRKLLAFAPFVLSFVAALLSSILLFSAGNSNGLVNAVISTGIDLLRAQLIAALIMALAGALIGALIGRRKLGAMLGASIVFCFVYLLAFVQLELLPVYDAGRHLEPLNTGTLIHTSLVILALGLLSSFFGATIGAALGEVVLDPIFALVYVILQRFAGRNQQRTPSSAAVRRQPTVFKRVYMWLGVMGMIGMIVLAGGSADLFLFSPDIGLHNAPNIQGVHGTQSTGTVVQDSLISSALGGQRRNFLIYLPPSYNTPQGRTKRYPTLYLLHGSPGSQRDWFTAGKADQSANTLIALKETPELLIVSPDGNGFERGTSEWGNSFDQKQLMETFVAHDLVQYVDAKYRTIPETAYRAIGGLSMGGFGAANIGVNHPDVFGFVLSMGGYYRADGIIWGNNAAYKRANSPLDVLSTDKAAWKLQFYLGDGFQDQPYYADTLQFAHELATLHINYHLDLQNGHHSWVLWQIYLYKALLWLHWGAS